MSLEAMKKDDLVKHARSLEQTVKMMEMEIEDLKAAVMVNNTSTSEVELPMSAVTLIKISKYKSVVAKIEFDLKGNSKVTVLTKPREHYAAAYDLEKFLSKDVIGSNKYFPEIISTGENV